MFLDLRQRNLIKKAIEDYNFIKEEIEYKIKQGYSLEDLEIFLNRFKNIEITSLDTVCGESYLDFLYKDINTFVCNTQEKGTYMGTTFEIYDREKYEYIIEGFLDVKSYENYINTPKEKMLEDAVLNLKYYDNHDMKEQYNEQRDKIINFLKEEW